MWKEEIDRMADHICPTLRKDYEEQRTAELHASMDQELDKKLSQLQRAHREGDTTKLWDLWSKAVEKAWLDQLRSLARPVWAV